MLFATAVYPFFLVLALAAYWLSPVAWRRHVLAAASLALLFYLTWRGTLVFVVLSVYVYALARRVRSGTLEPRTRTLHLAAALLVPLVYLAVFKYLPDYSPPIRQALEAITSGTLLLPLGISFFTFKFVHYVIESRRRTLPAHDFVDFLCYMAMFPTFAAGPIERFGNIGPQLRAPSMDSARLALGLERILSGMIKKVILSDLVFGSLLNAIGDVDANPAVHSAAILYGSLWCRLLLSYFDFSGYSDIAIGTAHLFGLTVIENFNWPLTRPNLSDFWRSWHISLSSWCRDYIYFPVFGLTRSPKIAVYASMVVLGYWHGANPKWICWGAWHASGLAVWQLWQVQRRRWPALMRWSQRSRGYRFAAWAITINFVALGTVWPSQADPIAAVKYLYHLFT